MDGALLTEVRNWVNGRRQMLEADGIQVDLDESRFGWAKASVTLVLEGPSTISQLTLWETGEMELEKGDISTGNINVEHRQVSSVEGVRQALDDLIRSQRGEEPTGH